MGKTNRKALLKPFQLLGLSAAFGIFVLLIVLLTTQNFVNGLIGAGITFVLSVVVLAMLVLSYKPNAEAPVYLDRFQADSDEPGAKASALKIDADAALRGEAAPADHVVTPDQASASPDDETDARAGDRMDDEDSTAS